jgi:hypothetical protein
MTETGAPTTRARNYNRSGHKRQRRGLQTTEALATDEGGSGGACNKQGRWWGPSQVRAAAVAPAPLKGDGGGSGAAGHKRARQTLQSTASPATNHSRIQTTEQSHFLKRAFRGFPLMDISKCFSTLDYTENGGQETGEALW